MIRVLLIDDHPIVRIGFKHLLEQAGDICVVAQAGDADAGYTSFLACTPDVCISDLSLPGVGGLELMRKILTHQSDARVIIFSMYDTHELVRRALDGGATGFVSKNALPESLVTAVRSAQAGQRYLSENISPVLLKRDSEAARLATLNLREFEILRLLAQGSSPADCADKLNLSLKTICNNQTNIKEKLGVSTLAALVHLALRNGIIEPSGAFMLQGVPAS